MLAVQLDHRFFPRSSATDAFASSAFLTLTVLRRYSDYFHVVKSFNSFFDVGLRSQFVNFKSVRVSRRRIVERFLGHDRANNNLIRLENEVRIGNVFACRHFVILTYFFCLSNLIATNSLGNAGFNKLFHRRLGNQKILRTKNFVSVQIGNRKNLDFRNIANA